MVARLVVSRLVSAILLLPGTFLAPDWGDYETGGHSRILDETANPPVSLVSLGVFLLLGVFRVFHPLFRPLEEKPKDNFSGTERSLEWGGTALLLTEKMKDGLPPDPCMRSPVSKLTLTNFVEKRIEMAGKVLDGCLERARRSGR